MDTQSPSLSKSKKTSSTILSPLPSPLSSTPHRNARPDPVIIGTNITLLFKLFSGGSYTLTKDGTFEYEGGETRLFPVSGHEKFSDLQARLLQEYGPCIFKYEFDGDLITIRSETDLEIARQTVFYQDGESLTQRKQYFIRAVLANPSERCSPRSELSFPSDPSGTTHARSYGDSIDTDVTAETLTRSRSVPLSTALRSPHSQGLHTPKAPAVLETIPGGVSMMERVRTQSDDAESSVIDYEFSSPEIPSDKVHFKPLRVSAPKCSTKFISESVMLAAAAAAAVTQVPDDEESEGFASSAGVFTDFVPGSRSPKDKAPWEISFSEITLHDLLGTGSFGRVYRASFRGTEVACKMLSKVDASQPSHVSEFRNEVHVLSEIRHPNAVLFMGACSAPETLAVITEYIPNGDLFGLLNSNLNLFFSERVGIAIDVAKCINHLHHCDPPILHLDLKTSNILVRKSDHGWTAKVADFGLSKHKTHTYISGTKGMRGTIPFMAPEVMCKEQFNEKADVFSFGRILWAMYARKEPFAGWDRQQMIDAVKTHNMALPIGPDCPTFYSSLINDCCQRSPQARPSFDHILARLRPAAHL